MVARASLERVEGGTSARQAPSNVGKVSLRTPGTPATIGIGLAWCCRCDTGLVEANDGIGDGEGASGARLLPAMVTDTGAVGGT